MLVRTGDDDDAAVSVVLDGAKRKARLCAVGEADGARVQPLFVIAFGDGVAVLVVAKAARRS